MTFAVPFILFIQSYDYRTTRLHLSSSFVSNQISLQISIELGFRWGWWWRVRCGNLSHSFISSFFSFLLPPFFSSPTSPAPREPSIMRRLLPSTLVPVLLFQDSREVSSFSTLSRHVSNPIAVKEF